jgi:hypothetical protein
MTAAGCDRGQRHLGRVRDGCGVPEAGGQLRPTAREWGGDELVRPRLGLQEPHAALALAAFVRSQDGVQWNEMMTANLPSTLPVLIVYFLVQKKLRGGIASVGLKGPTAHGGW